MGKSNSLRVFKLFLLLAVTSATTPSISAPTESQNSYILRYETVHHPVRAQGGMVSSQNALSTAVGQAILSAGGNAIDAAVAVGFSLAVTLPRAGNLGGGGFMMVHIAKDKQTIAIDYRGTAPMSVSAANFLDAEGRVDKSLSKTGFTASTVPGTVAGLFEAHQRWGRLPWHTLLAGAIRQAEQGIEVSEDLAWAIGAKAGVLKSNPDSRRIFFKAEGEPFKAGDNMPRKALAKTLKQIAAKGRAGFYRGRVARQIAREMKAHGGFIREQDLADYKVEVKTPLATDYRGYKVHTMPPPAGGIHLIQMLNMLEGYPVESYGHNSANSLHILAEVMKRAYAFRAKYLGDPAFVDVPVNWLISKRLALSQMETVKMQRATPVAEIAPSRPAELQESADTTHFSVMDREGNVVSNTYTLSASFGSGVTIADTGILMNNQINNFALRYGVPGASGANASFANALQGGKRTKSTQTPLIVFKDQIPLLATGTPGGRRIITTMLQIISNVVDHHMNIADATHAPRIFHGWAKDELEYEPGISPDTLKLLRERGHTLKLGATMGSVQSVMWNGSHFSGASDPRRPGASTLGSR